MFSPWVQSIKDKQGLTGITKRQARLLKKRDCQIGEAMNRCVTWVVDYALQHRIGTVVLPRWDGIKDKINHGKRGNQNFVQVPYHKFRQKLKSKCELYPIFPPTHNEVGGFIPRSWYSCTCASNISPTRSAFPGYSKHSMTSSLSNKPGNV